MMTCWALPYKMNLTSVFWSVLNLSRRFLRVFLKPPVFSFSDFAAGSEFLWTWTAPLFNSKDTQSKEKPVYVNISYTILYVLSIFASALTQLQHKDKPASASLI